MSDELDSIIARVQKLRALADPTKNDNINEVKAAASLYEKLVNQYRLTAAQLESEGHGAKQSFKDAEVVITGRRMRYYEEMLNHLCKHFNGAWFYQSGRNRDNKGECLYFLSATESDHAIICYFFNYLIWEVDRLTKKNCKGTGIQESNSYRAGVVAGIGSLFADLQEKTRQDANNCTAMVVLDNRAKEVKQWMYTEHHLKAGNAISGSRGSSDARNAGYSAGRGVSINKGLNG